MKLVVGFSIIVFLAAPAIAQDGDETVASAGGEIYSKSQVYENGGARLKNIAYWGKGIFRSEYPAGMKLVSVTTKVAFKACKEWVGTSTLQPCFLDDDGNGVFDRIAASETASAVELDVSVPYERDAFKQVILYQGATADSLRFSYREFSVDLARPAFTEELVIPREPFPQMVAIKGLQIEVSGVTGMGLRFRMVKADLAPAQTLTRE